MKIIVANIVMGFFVLLSADVASAETVKDKTDSRRERIIERFDEDGDGTLNKQERQSAREAAQKFKHKKHQWQKRINKFDTDGDGKLSREEREAARKHHIMKKFDEDGDGVLSEEERATAESARLARESELLERFDKNGDGDLSAQERGYARRIMKNERRKQWQAELEDN